MDTVLLREYKPTIHNGTGVDEIELIEQHENLINQGNYSDAANLIQNNNLDGVTASLFNSYEIKLKQLDEYLQSKEFYNPYLYSNTEPTEAELEGKIIWAEEY